MVVLGVNREDTEEKEVDKRTGAVSGINREEERRRRAIEVIQVREEREKKRKRRGRVGGGEGQ